MNWPWRMAGLAVACLSLAGFHAFAADSISILTYNADGDCSCSSNWNTSLPLVAAQGREMMYLKPDIVTFVEIPQPYTYQMTNFANAFLPGYFTATNSKGDGYLTSVTLSRFPIIASASHLHGTSLAAFGASGHTFTRDLFQTTILIPGFAKPLDVFSTHLKATSSATSSNSTTFTDGLRRGAEAAAISNWFVTVYLPTNNGRLYTISGDMNEDIARPGANYVSGHPIQALTSPATGLRLTTPTNPATGSELTDDIQTTLDVRFDYILPCGLLYSNILDSQVFRTDVLNPLPSGLNTDDDVTASDHLLVLMVFKSPYEQPFVVTSITRTNDLLTLNWQAIPGQIYQVEASYDLSNWFVLVSKMATTNYTLSFTTNSPVSTGFFRVHQGL